MDRKAHLLLLAGLALATGCNGSGQATTDPPTEPSETGPVANAFQETIPTDPGLGPTATSPLLTIEDPEKPLLRLTNPTSATWRFTGYSDTFPVYGTEQLTEGAWQPGDTLWCGTGVEMHPLEPGKSFVFEPILRANVESRVCLTVRDAGGELLRIKSPPLTVTEETVIHFPDLERWRSAANE